MKNSDYNKKYNNNFLSGYINIFHKLNKFEQIEKIISKY